MKYFYILFTLLFVISCNKTEYKNSNCDILKQNKFVYDYMQKNYLWNRELPSLDYTKYGSPFELLEDLKVKIDRWSFIMPKEVLDAYYSGLGYVGLGLKLKYFQNELYIALVYPNSPASRASLKRGDKVIKINNKATKGKDYNFINSAFGYDQEGVKVELEIEDKNKTIKPLTLYKEKIIAPSVLEDKIFVVDGIKVGYILFDKFIEPSNEELDRVFKRFKANDIEKIVIDLRYNSGGLVNVANHFVSLLIGKDYHNEISFKLKFNEDNSFKNQKYFIQNLKESLALYDVYFLTTKRSCSASEALINALKPYNIDIHIIGSRTCGKPVGMMGDDFCDFYLMPIEFKITNANDEGDYFNGLDATCLANDNIFYELGDSNESMLKEAFYLMENGICNTKKASRVINLTKEPTLNGFREFNGGAF